jgi:hypothetical protein
MPTECSAKTFDFARVESRAVVAAFDGGAATNDAGGLLLLGATDRAIGLSGRFAACFFGPSPSGPDRAPGAHAGEPADISGEDAAH